MDVAAAAVCRVDPYTSHAESSPAPRAGPDCPNRRPLRVYAGGVTKPTFCIRNSSVGLIVEPTTFFCIR